MRTKTVAVKMTKAETAELRGAARVTDYISATVQEAIAEERAKIIAEQKKLIAKLQRALRKIARDGGTTKMYAWDIPAYAKKVLEKSR